MRSTIHSPRLSLISVVLFTLLLFGALGCDSLDDDTDSVVGQVEAIDGTGSITVDGVVYYLVNETTFEGYQSILELEVGDAVEIEYESMETGRNALIIRPAGEGVQ